MINPVRKFLTKILTIPKSGEMIWWNRIFTIHIFFMPVFISIYVLLLFIIINKTGINYNILFYSDTDIETTIMQVGGWIFIAWVIFDLFCPTIKKKNRETRIGRKKNLHRIDNKETSE